VIVFQEAGRLGNQLLQYAVLRAHFPHERLVLLGFGALREAVACERTWFVQPRGLGRSLVSRLHRVLAWCAARGWIGEGGEVRSGDACRLEWRRGRLGALTLIRLSFFQHADFEACIAPTLALRERWLEPARRALAELLAQAGGGVPVFVHVRRGDYASFPSPEAPAALPAAWYRAAMDHVRAREPAAVFVVCSDNLDWARQELEGEPRLVYCDRGEIGDLALMSSCAGGVMSPSTFSWWAAVFARRALAAAGRSGAFVAPRYWVGHRSGAWYPGGFRFDWISYL